MTLSWPFYYLNVLSFKELINLFCSVTGGTVLLKNCGLNGNSCKEETACC